MYVYVCSHHCLRREVGLSRCVRVPIGCTRVCGRINRNVCICGPGIIFASPHPQQVDGRSGMVGILDSIQSLRD